MLKHIMTGAQGTLRGLWCILRTGRSWHPRMAWVAADDFRCPDCGMTFNFPKGRAGD